MITQTKRCTWSNIQLIILRMLIRIYKETHPNRLDLLLKNWLQSSVKQTLRPLISLERTSDRLHRSWRWWIRSSFFVLYICTWQISKMANDRLNWKIYCDDHSWLWSTTAVQMYELFHIYFTFLKFLHKNYLLFRNTNMTAIEHVLRADC